MTLPSGSVTQPSEGFPTISAAPDATLRAPETEAPAAATAEPTPGPRPRRVPANRGRRYPAEVLTSEEVRGLIRAASGRAPSGIRNRALLAVMYRAGLRVAEALALFPKDVDAAAGTVRVLHGKGDMARTVALDPEAFALLERWLDRRVQLGHNGRAPLFCTLDGGPLLTGYVRALLPRLARRAGIEKRVHAHGLRHSFAAGLAQEGVPMNVIQAALGHSSLATTSRYLAHVAPQHVIETLKARTW
jgi:site-specific recombinase XerD